MIGSNLMVFTVLTQKDALNCKKSRLIFDQVALEDY